MTLDEVLEHLRTLPDNDEVEIHFQAEGIDGECSLPTKVGELIKIIEGMKAGAE